MTAASDLWTDAMKTWQGMIPPLVNPAILDPLQAARVSMGIQRSALDTWRESCLQAFELGAKGLDWQADTVLRLAQASQDKAR